MVSQEPYSPMCQKIVNPQLHNTQFMIGYREIGHISPKYWNLFRKRQDELLLSVKFLNVAPLPRTGDAKPLRHLNGKDHELRTRTKI
jgi:hypothetical protein